MKKLIPLLSLSPGKSAVIAAFSLLGATGFAALKVGPPSAALTPPATPSAAVAQPRTVAAPSPSASHSAAVVPPASVSSPRSVPPHAPAGVSPGAPMAASPSGIVPSAPVEDIRDIRGPIHIAAPFPWLAWTGGSLGALALGLGAWAWFRRPRRKLPYELALEKLAKLRALMQPESAQAFSLAVSEIVRVFIEKCFPVRAAHHTTGEFLHDLVDLTDSPLAAHRDTLADFLGHCDLAKFARWQLTVPQMEAMLESASTFVTSIGKPKAAKKQPAAPAAKPATELVTANS